MSNSAKCLCGKVTIQPQNINPEFTVCHCNSCRKWGGGPLFMVQCGTEVNFEGQEFITEYNSSAWASRAFCSGCGTHLYARFKETNSFNVPVGLFPNTPELTMSMQYFSDLRPSYYCFSNETPEMTEAQVLAYFGGSESEI